MDWVSSFNETSIAAFPLSDAESNDSTFSRWISLAASLYLFIRSNEYYNVQMPLLLYIEMNLPSILLSLARGSFGRWITFIVVSSYLCFRQLFRGYVGLLTALILFTWTFPFLLVQCLHNNIIGEISSVGIALYALYSFFRFRGLQFAFLEKEDCIKIAAIILLLLSPLLELYEFVS
eukprot:TRINITY_DN12433_c0_g1_i1.p1 TRINITY_DN12433_c0_g1~~TRINITY_DN12433_c0_g1_i1.p1  ORF type:complete len:177 (+),score=7.76 TRINITY_DN12433_c0_g1_i1:81-611(+)